MRDTSRYFSIFFNRVTIFIAAVLLAGCASTPRSDGPPRAPEDLHNWQASGRMAVSGAEGGGSGSFNWRQQGDESQVSLRGPVGIGSLTLSIDASGLRIDTGEQTLAADAAQAELSARLGAEVPVQSLRYWLRGEPAPGEHVWQRTEDVATLEQQGWRIEYRKFDAASGQLPTRLVASNGPAKVRILIDRWKFE